MSIHIAAQQGEIADKILLPGDPLRAKFIAENFLEDAVCFNEEDPQEEEFYQQFHPAEQQYG